MLALEWHTGGASTGRLRQQPAFNVLSSIGLVIKISTCASQPRCLYQEEDYIKMPSKYGKGFLTKAVRICIVHSALALVTLEAVEKLQRSRLE